MSKICIYIIFITSCLLKIQAQGIHNTRFGFSDYNGGLENWDFCDVGQNLAVANNEGLLFYSNGSWKCNTIKREISPKAVFYQNNKLYTAFGNRVGYFKIVNDTISGFFIPIAIPFDVPDFNTVWKIVSTRSGIFFQTEKHVMEIRNNVFYKKYAVSGFVRCMFKIGEDIYFVDSQKGLLKNFVSVPNGQFFATKEINVILPFANGDLLISDYKDNTFYRYNHLSALAIWDNEVIANYPFCGLKTNANFMIGTTENGIYELDEKGEIIKNLNAQNHLKYNKVFGLFQDKNNFIWAGLENGIDRFRFDLPYTNIDFENKHGNAENIETIDSITYFLSSTGINYLPCTHIFAQNASYKLKSWGNINGPSYFIKKINNSLIFGHLTGVFQYKDGVRKKIIDAPFCNEIKIINSQYFIVRSLNNWLLFEIANKEITFLRNLKLPQDFQVIEDKIVWSIGNQLFQQNYNTDMTFSKINSFKVPENIERLFVKNDTLFLINSLGTFYISSSQSSKLITSKYHQDHIYDLDHTRTKIDQHHLKRNLFFDSNFPMKTQISELIQNILKINHDKLNFIKQIDDSLLCLGTYKGYTIINTNKVITSNTIKFGIKEIIFVNGNKKNKYTTLNGQEIFQPLDKIEITILLAKQTLPQTPYYRLKLIKDGKTAYSNWTTSNTLSIEHIESGKYEVTIEQKDWFGNIQKINAGNFTISKEHKIQLFLKLGILTIIMFFLFGAFRTIYSKKASKNKILSSQSEQ